MALSALTNSVVRFPLVAATLAVRLLVAVLLSAVQAPAAQRTASAYALLVAMARSGSMVKSLLKGRWGIDLLAVTAIASTVAVGEYVASLIIVLMLAGGERWKRSHTGAQPGNSSPCLSASRRQPTGSCRAFRRKTSRQGMSAPGMFS
ncbi:hypothetical protein [Arthrobacter sp. 4R501]|uniref:hypothetical protein n=1 Tax=Arthrobacter sp. 4R501 TaxID=2058886 RepID=UPI00280070F9|nr:hypothetical protein [Arthrobacter sp. 4R501]